MAIELVVLPWPKENQDLFATLTSSFILGSSVAKVLEALSAVGSVDGDVCPPGPTIQALTKFSAD